MPEDSVAVAEPASAQEPSSSSGSDIYHHKLGESSSGDLSRESSESKPAQAPEAQKPKELSRYERTKRERAAFKAERAAFQREREAFARDKAAQAAKPKRDYTVGELQKYRGQWEREGQFDLVEAADKEIAVMQQEAQAERASRTVEMPPMGSPEHRAQWEAVEAELYQADPEFMRAGTRLDTRLRQIMGGADGNIYRQHPRGIVAAYHRAKMELLEADNKGLQTENSKLQNELKRYVGLTGLGSGAPARMGNGSRVESLSDFQRLSTKDMRKHLLAGADKNGVPWF
jgi:hypothetical protein